MSLFSITIAELLLGIGALPRSKRKNRLAAALDGVLDLLTARILPFDTAAARRHGELAVKTGASRKGFPAPDGYIAAARGFTVASRDPSALNAQRCRFDDNRSLDFDPLIGVERAGHRDRRNREELFDLGVKTTPSPSMGEAAR